MSNWEMQVKITKKHMYDWVKSRFWALISNGRSKTWVAFPVGWAVDSNEHSGEQLTPSRWGVMVFRMINYSGPLSIQEKAWVTLHVRWAITISGQSGRWDRWYTGDLALHFPESPVCIMLLDAFLMHVNCVFNRIQHSPDFTYFYLSRWQFRW